MLDETATADVEQDTTEQPQPFAGLEPESSDETVEQVGGEVGETSDAETQVADEPYQLPDEQLKVFPDAEYQKFAEKRYPELARLLNDQNLPEPTRASVKQIIHDKLNGDIRIDQLQKAGEEIEEEPLEEQELEPTQQLAPEEQQKQWDTALSTFVEKNTDPATAKKFMADLRAVAEIKDPVERDMAEVKVLSKGVANLVPAILDDYLFTPGPNGQSLLEQWLESRLPGITANHQESARSSAWDQVAQSPEFAGLKLPTYGTPEWMQSVNKVAAMVPGFEKARFSNDPIQNFAAKARIHAQLLAGTATQSTVATAVKAVEKGRQIEKQATQRKALGNLGAGQTKGVIAQNANELPSDKARKEAIARLKQDENPFAALNVK